MKLTDAERVRILRSAVQTFYTWATFNHGIALYPPDVAALAAKALARTGEAPRLKEEA